MIRITLAVVHLLALGIGLGAIYARARALNTLTAPDALRRVFACDNWWGAAAGLWIITGVWRAFGGLEKSPAYYWNNHVFYAKMAMFALIFLLEVWPMVTLIRWRSASRKQALPPLADLAPTGRRLARISDVQTLLVAGVVVAAAMMARGYGLRP